MSTDDLKPRRCPEEGGKALSTPSQPSGGEAFDGWKILAKIGRGAGWAILFVILPALLGGALVLGIGELLKATHNMYTERVEAFANERAAEIVEATLQTMPPDCNQYALWMEYPGAIVMHNASPVAVPDTVGRLYIDGQMWLGFEVPGIAAGAGPLYVMTELPAGAPTDLQLRSWGWRIETANGCTWEGGFDASGLMAEYLNQATPQAKALSDVLVSLRALKREFDFTPWKDKCALIREGAWPGMVDAQAYQAREISGRIAAISAAPIAGPAQAELASAALITSTNIQYLLNAINYPSGCSPASVDEALDDKWIDSAQARLDRWSELTGNGGQ